MVFVCVNVHGVWIFLVCCLKIQMAVDVVRYATKAYVKDYNCICSHFNFGTKDSSCEWIAIADS